jgi:hypothetical protein
MTRPTCSCGACTHREGDPLDPKEYLECAWRAGRTLGRLAHCDFEQWSRFEGPAKAWWRAGIESGEISEPDLAWYAASCVLSPLEQGLIGRPDWDWNVLTGYDLTFDSLGHAGLMFGWTAAEICQAMMSFLRFFGERDLVDRGHVSRLLGELETWGPRLERYFHHGGPWFLADGTRCS